MFGEIKEGNVYLTDYGIKAAELWLEIPKHYSNIKLDEFVVMPDHIHGIVFIVGYRHACTLPTRRQNQKLPIVIGSYKSAVSREINKDTFFQWQKSYYGRMIRNENEYKNIKR